MPDETLVIEAPPQQTTERPSAMEAAVMDGIQGIPEDIVQKVKAKQAAKPDAVRDDGGKPDAKKTEIPPDDKSKKPWEKLPGIEDKKAADEKKPAVEHDEELTPPKGLDEKGGARWKELKMAEKRLPTLEAENAALKKQIADGETGKSEMTLKELESLRKEKIEIEQLVAEKKLERSDDFKKTVIEPIATANNQIAKLVELSKIDSAAMQKAVGINDEMERIDAIGKLLEGLESPLRPMQESALYKAVENLHAAWKAEDGLRVQAREIETAADAKSQAATAQSEKTRAEEWSKASDTMFDTLAAKIPLLKDPDVARQVREAAVKSDDVMDQAYRAQAGALLPQIVKERNTLSARVTELEGVIADMNGSRPSTEGRQELLKGDDEFKGMSPSQAVLGHYG